MNSSIANRIALWLTTAILSFIALPAPGQQVDTIENLPRPGSR